MDKNLVPCARWTDDCQGKKDYDGRLLSISAHYWPGVEGQRDFNTYDAPTSQFSILPYGRDGRPSAKATIHLDHGEPDEYGYGDYLVWREQEFVADTEAEVKAMVEAWVRERFEEIQALLGPMKLP
jgi:hypothetical protein